MEVIDFGFFEPSPIGTEFIFHARNGKDYYAEVIRITHEVGHNHAVVEIKE